ncbi:DUF397 domain-containing protein [Streptomyces sp. NPDC050085]|uniref:DUF397 domain-containing protein n=1 Tax=Streptomyces sp. NPDC050085 TaxID=3365600 RepID=UPI00378FB9E8
MSHDRPHVPCFRDEIWRTSSYSGGQGECVEVAPTHPNTTPVRDTKLNPAGPVLTFSRPAWRAFLARL